MIVVIGGVLVFLLWFFYRPYWDPRDWSFSTRRSAFWEPYWKNTLVNWFALKCGVCGSWAPRGCEESGHMFCGICAECRDHLECGEEEEESQDGC